MFNSAPPPVRAAAAAALKGLITKDIIKKIITPPMSPFSPPSPPPPDMSSHLHKRPSNSRARSPQAPPVTSPKSGSKHANRKASDLGVFKADFVVSEKRLGLGGVFYLIRLYYCRVRISSRLARA